MKHKGKVNGERTYGEHPGPSHGSPMQTHRVGSGGGYATKPISIGMHPGATIKNIKTNVGGHFEGGAESYKPKKMSTYREE